LVGVGLFGRPDDDPRAVDLFDDPRPAGHHRGAGIAGHDAFHAGATRGASAWISGTACFCMFEPIKARLASSFSRNGISEAATDTTCLGETSMKVIWSRAISIGSPLIRPGTRSSITSPLSERLMLAWAMACLASSMADM